MVTPPHKCQAVILHQIKLESNNKIQPKDPADIEGAIEILRAFTGLVLFCYYKDDISLRDRIAGNFMARGMSCLDSIYRVWESGSEQDAWILFRALIDRFFHLRHLNENDEFDSFDDFSFVSMYEARNRLLSNANPIMKNKIPSSLLALQRKNQNRYQDIKSKNTKWKRPKAEDVAKKMDAKFLYDIGYDYASTHVHPMSNDGTEDFNRLTSPTQKGDIPDATVIRNAILLQTVLMNEALNISSFKFRRIVYTFIDDIQSFLIGDNSTYKITFLKIANAGPNFKLCTQEDEV